MNAGPAVLALLMAVASAVAAEPGAGATAAQPATAESLRARWDLPPRCTPFDPPRIADLKEELRQTGYRLVIAIHPAAGADASTTPPKRHLFLVNADGTGLKQITSSPDQEECTPRVAPDGKHFTYNYGDFLVDAATLKAREYGGGYVWAPDSRRTAEFGKKGIVFTDIATGEQAPPIRAERKVSIVDLSHDGQWFIFEIRDYLGKQYTIDFMSAAGGPIRKLPNHPIADGECHPAFSPDGQWMCWNSGGSLSVRKFDPALPDGTDGKIITLPKEKLGQDPCGRWSHCGRYIAYTQIPHAGSWRVHSPICIVRLADAATITISPPGWVGHHWDYDWLPAEEKQN